MNKELNEEPHISVICHRCGEKYPFDDFRMLDSIDISTPCRKCGFKLFDYSLKKIIATQRLIETDSKALELIKQGNYKDFKKYLKEKCNI